MILVFLQDLFRVPHRKQWCSGEEALFFGFVWVERERESNNKNKNKFYSVNSIIDKYDNYRAFDYSVGDASRKQLNLKIGACSRRRWRFGLWIALDDLPWDPSPAHKVLSGEPPLRFR